MTQPHSFNDSTGHQLFAVIGKVRRMSSVDLTYHTGRKKKESASPFLEFLHKFVNTARRMPQYYAFDPRRADGIRHADLMEGERA